MFALAFKNILFYKARSITTFLLTLFSMFLFIIYVSFMNGAHNSMLKNALEIYTSSMQIYQKNYRDEGGYDNLIYDNKKIFSILKKEKDIIAFSSRLEIFGILSSDDASSAIMLTGVDFAKEKKISKLSSALRSGDYDSSGACLYLGEDLAKKLSLKLGDEISFVGTAINYSFVADIFKVCGTFKTGMYEFDNSSVFLNRTYFDTLFYSHNTSTYIAIAIDDLSKSTQVAKSISKKLDNNTKVYTWRVLMKSMVEFMQVDSIFGYISIGLFFLVIFFVIMIYGFINISSRIREFGTLKSIGLSDSDIDKLLFYEIGILTTLALLIATPLGAFVAYYFEVHPLVIKGISEVYKDYGIISDTVPTSFDMFTIMWNTLVIVALNLLSIVYPIIYVRGFTPVEAMRHV